jgi:hypothetical protein
MGALYDDWVLKPGDLPVESVLAKAGLRLVVEGKKTSVREDLGANEKQASVRESLLHRAPIQL